MHQLGLIVFLNKHTEPRTTEPLQVAPHKRLTPPGPSPLETAPPPPTPPPPPRQPFILYSLGNERKITKQIKNLELKKVNERIHLPSEKCLVIPTYVIRSLDITWNNFSIVATHKINPPLNSTCRWISSIWRKGGSESYAEMIWLPLNAPE